MIWAHCDLREIDLVSVMRSVPSVFNILFLKIK